MSCSDLSTFGNYLRAGLDSWAVESLFYHFYVSMKNKSLIVATLINRVRKEEKRRKEK